MKLVRENINFKRGLDPKEAMGTGISAMPLSKRVKPGDILYYEGGQGSIPAKYIKVIKMNIILDERLSLVYKEMKNNGRFSSEDIWSLDKNFFNTYFKFVRHSKIRKIRKK